MCLSLLKTVPAVWVNNNHACHQEQTRRFAKGSSRYASLSALPSGYASKIRGVVATSLRKYGSSRSCGTYKAAVPQFAATGRVVSVGVARVVLMQAFAVKLGTAEKQVFQNYVSGCKQIMRTGGVIGLAYRSVLSMKCSSRS